MFKVKSYLPKFDNGIDLVKFREKYPEFKNVADDILYSKIQANPDLLNSLNNPVNPIVNTTNTLSNVNPNFKFYNYNANGTEKPMAEQFDLAGTTNTTPTTPNTTGNADATSAYANIAAGLGTAGVNAIDKGTTYTDYYGNKTNVESSGAAGIKGSLKGAAIGANPALATATGGLSIVGGALIGGAIGTINQKSQEKKAQRELKESNLRFTNDKISEGMNKVNSMQSSG